MTLAWLSSSQSTGWMQSVTTKPGDTATIYKCIVCERKFQNSALGYVHFMNHFSKEFCSVCKKFIARENWARHCMIEHNRLTHECTHCHFLYMKKSECDKHVARKHTGPWIYCKKCDKRYCTLNGFKAHGCQPFSKHVPDRSVPSPVPSDSGLEADPVKNGGSNDALIFANERRGFAESEAFIPGVPEDQ